MTEFDKPTTPNEACTHKKATHVHGTYACYVLDKCRCGDCRAAVVAYRRDEVRRRNYVAHGRKEYARLVDAGPARAHVRALMAAGLGTKQIYKRAGVGHTVIHGLIWGRPDRNGGKPTPRISRSVEARILAVPIPGPSQLAGGAKVDPQPSINRLRALMHLGYSINRLAEFAGLDHQRFHGLTSGRHTTTSASTHAAIEQLFKRLWNTRPVPRDRFGQGSITRSVKYAEKRGWPMPLDLDDDGYLLTDDLEEDVEAVA